MKTHEKEEWTTQELVLRTLETARDHIKQYREYSEEMRKIGCGLNVSSPFTPEYFDRVLDRAIELQNKEVKSSEKSGPRDYLEDISDGTSEFWLNVEFNTERGYDEDLERDITDLLEARLLFHWFRDSLIHESQRHEFR